MTSRSDNRTSCNAIGSELANTFDSSFRRAAYGFRVIYCDVQ